MSHGVGELAPRRAGGAEGAQALAVAEPVHEDPVARGTHGVQPVRLRVDRDAVDLRGS